MRLTKGALITLLAALAASVAVASLAQTKDRPIPQEPPPQQYVIQDCPTVTVSCQDKGLVGQLVTFSAGIAGGSPDVTPTFKWTVPNFNILSGEDTSEITVGTPAQGGKIVATVEVGGYDRACSMTASCTTFLIADPSLRKVGEYVGPVLDDEKSQLANFAAELRNDPTAQGFFVCYGGRRSTPGEAQRRCDRAMKYTSRYPWAADPARLLTVDAGYRCEPLVEL